MSSPSYGDLAWRKSSHSHGSGDCVEVAQIADGVAVRDSKDPAGPVLVFGLDQWRNFLDDVSGGEFDH